MLNHKYALDLVILSINAFNNALLLFCENVNVLSILTLLIPL